MEQLELFEKEYQEEITLTLPDAYIGQNYSIQLIADPILEQGVIVLRNPNGEYWEVKVDENGNLVTERANG